MHAERSSQRGEKMWSQTYNEAGSSGEEEARERWRTKERWRKQGNVTEERQKESEEGRKTREADRG